MDSTRAMALLEQAGAILETIHGEMRQIAYPVLRNEWDQAYYKALVTLSGKM